MPLQPRKAPASREARGAVNRRSQSGEAATTEEITTKNTKRTKTFAPVSDFATFVSFVVTFWVEKRSLAGGPFRESGGTVFALSASSCSGSPGGLLPRA
jgi:hypothetical protein